MPNFCPNCSEKLPSPNPNFCPSGASLKKQASLALPIEVTEKAEEETRAPQFTNLAKNLRNA